MIHSYLKEHKSDVRNFSTNKRRRILGSLVCFLIITTPLAYLKYQHIPQAGATWFDDNYYYREKITIGNSGSATSNKKVKLDIDTATLTTEKMQADCDDIRFTDITGAALDFYLDGTGGACDGAV